MGSFCMHACMWLWYYSLITCKHFSHGVCACMHGSLVTLTLLSNLNICHMGSLHACMWLWYYSLIKRFWHGVFLHACMWLWYYSLITCKHFSYGVWSAHACMVVLWLWYYSLIKCFSHGVCACMHGSLVTLTLLSNLNICHMGSLHACMWLWYYSLIKRFWHGVFLHACMWLWYYSLITCKHFSHGVWSAHACMVVLWLWYYSLIKCFSHGVRLSLHACMHVTLILLSN